MWNVTADVHGSENYFPGSDISRCVCVSEKPNGWPGLKIFGHSFFSSECIQITRKAALEQMHARVYKFKGYVTKN